jgi:hypothetical protein
MAGLPPPISLSRSPSVLNLQASVADLYDRSVYQKRHIRAEELQEAITRADQLLIGKRIWQKGDIDAAESLVGKDIDPKKIDSFELARRVKRTAGFNRAIQAIENAKRQLEIVQYRQNQKAELKKQARWQVKLEKAEQAAREAKRSALPKEKPSILPKAVLNFVTHKINILR